MNTRNLKQGNQEDKSNVRPQRSETLHEVNPQSVVPNQPDVNPGSLSHFGTLAQQNMFKSQAGMVGNVAVQRMFKVPVQRRETEELSALFDNSEAQPTADIAAAEPEAAQAGFGPPPLPGELGRSDFGGGLMQIRTQFGPFTISSTVVTSPIPDVPEGAPIEMLMEILANKMEASATSAELPEKLPGELGRSDFGGGLMQIRTQFGPFTVSSTEGEVLYSPIPDIAEGDSIDTLVTTLEEMVGGDVEDVSTAEVASPVLDSSPFT